MKDSYEELGILEGISGFDIDPPLGSKLGTWLLAEPEFSRLLVAHLTANLLVFVDNSRRDRPPLIDGYIFDESAVGVMPSGHLPAHRLIDVLKDSKLIDDGHLWRSEARGTARFRVPHPQAPQSAGGRTPPLIPHRVLKRRPNPTPNIPLV